MRCSPGHALLGSHSHHLGSVQGLLKTQEMGKTKPQNTTPEAVPESRPGSASQQRGCGHGGGGSAWGEMVLHAIPNGRNMAYRIGKRSQKKKIIDI